MFFPPATFTTYVNPSINHAFLTPIRPPQSLLATSDQDFATVDKNIDILWTTA
jgi:hypothetical protein